MIFLLDKFIGSVMGKDVVQKDKYIAMITAKYSQMHSKQQVIIVQPFVFVPGVGCLHVHMHVYMYIRMYCFVCVCVCVRVCTVQL